MADLNAGPTGSGPSYLTNVNGTLFFAANDGVHGTELWKTDGTGSGTVLVKDIDPGSVGSNIKGIVNVNGTLYFSANDGTHGNELWKSDGTAAGTVLVQDINLRSVDANPANFTVLGNSLLFTADDGFHGTELWKLPIASSTNAAQPGSIAFAAVTTSSETGGGNTVAISNPTGVTHAHRQLAQRFDQALSARVHRAAQIAGTDELHTEIVDESSAAAVIETSLVAKPSAFRLSPDTRLPTGMRIATDQETQRPWPSHYPATSTRIFANVNTQARLSSAVVDQVIPTTLDRAQIDVSPIAIRWKLRYSTVCSD